VILGKLESDQGRGREVSGKHRQDQHTQKKPGNLPPELGVDFWGVNVMRIIRSSIIGLAFTSAIIGSQEKLTAQGRLDVVTVGIYGDTIFAAEAENIKKRMKQIRATAKREKLRRGSPRWLELKQKQSDLQKKLDDLSNVPVTTIHFFGVATGWDKTDEVLLHLRNNRADIGRQICVWQDERVAASFGDERWIVSDDCAADVGGTVFRQQKQRNVAGTYEASWGADHMSAASHQCGPLRLRGGRAIGR